MKYFLCEIKVVSSQTEQTCFDFTNFCWIAPICKQYEKIGKLKFLWFQIPMTKSSFLQKVSANSM